MLKRKATDYIKNWLNTKDRKCLVVQGARQTGKTYIIERFAEENFEELVEINFKQMPSAMEIFRRSYGRQYGYGYAFPFSGQENYPRENFDFSG